MKIYNGVIKFCSCIYFYVKNPKKYTFLNVFIKAKTFEILFVASTVASNCEFIQFKKPLKYKINNCFNQNSSNNSTC